MDDEDRALAAESRSLETNQAYSALGSTSSDGRYQSSFMDLLKPQGEGMGVKLLRRMGWRNGQGIGPKVKRKADLDDNDEEVEELHSFAPHNVQVIHFTRKNDRKGLGFAGEGRLGLMKPSLIDASDVGDDSPGLLSADRTMSKNRSQARTGIGTGILNDGDGDEDEDPYSMGPRLSHNKTIGIEKKTKKSKSQRSDAETAPASLSSKSKPVLKVQRGLKADTGFRKCADGRLPLDGFTLSKILASLDLSSSENKYPLPKVPRDWKPANVVKEMEAAGYQSTADAAKSSSLNAKSRAALLGESQLPGKSVFDFMSASTRDRIATATGREDLPAALGEGLPKTESGKPERQSGAPTVSKAVALGALGGYMPYSEDEAKRERYQAFLEYHGDVQQKSPLRPEGMHSDKWNQELAEFAHAAEVFKPVTGMMASRFTSASSNPVAEPPKDGHADSSKRDLTNAKAASDPAEQAASLDQYGPLTRSTEQWFPARLLCKRFNVKLPAHAEGCQGVESNA